MSCKDSVVVLVAEFPGLGGRRLIVTSAFLQLLLAFTLMIALSLGSLEEEEVLVKFLVTGVREGLAY